MGRKHYNKDFKVMLVELLRSGVTAKQLGEEYNIHDSLIRRWNRELESDSKSFTSKKSISPEAQELKLIKKQLRDLTEERDILKKAVSIFSKSDK
jgi:transposase